MRISRANARQKKIDGTTAILIHASKTNAMHHMIGAIKNAVDCGINHTAIRAAVCKVFGTHVFSPGADGEEAEWISQNGERHIIGEMDERHVRNALRMVQRQKQAGMLLTREQVANKIAHAIGMPVTIKLDSSLVDRMRERTATGQALEHFDVLTS